jgi:hypothetical protein
MTRAVHAFVCYFVFLCVCVCIPTNEVMKFACCTTKFGLSHDLSTPGMCAEQKRRERGSEGGRGSPLMPDAPRERVLIVHLVKPMSLSLSQAWRVLEGGECVCALHGRRTRWIITKVAVIK